MQKSKGGDIKRAFAILFAALMVIGMTACSTRDADDGSSASSPGGTPAISIPPPVGYVPENYPDYQDLIDEWKAINDETVGWLSVPGTDINDVVVCRMDPEDYNQYYYRRNAKGEESFNGCFYADCRNQFDGTIAGLSRNTTIYGHSMEIPDDPDGSLFSQLKRYWEEDYARENPYIYFSIDGQDMVWEIFAAYYTNRFYDDYIDPMDDWNSDKVRAHIAAIRERSEYNYEVDVDENDKFLTLSTCLYHLSNDQYPNDYRWAITAKLVDDGVYKEQAELTVNEDPIAPEVSE